MHINCILSLRSDHEEDDYIPAIILWGWENKIANTSAQGHALLGHSSTMCRPIKFCFESHCQTPREMSYGRRITPVSEPRCLNPLCLNPLCLNPSGLFYLFTTDITVALTLKPHNNYSTLPIGLLCLLSSDFSVSLWTQEPYIKFQLHNVPAVTVCRTKQ